MQMLDINTASLPLSVVRIEVERLFGKYTYTLAKKDNNPHIDSSLIILYGDNGSGKTTILKLLFHLLSTGRQRGHLTFLAKTPFANFSVFLADGTSIIASRKNDNLIGSFKLKLLQNNHVIFSIEISVDNDVKVIQKIQDYELYIYEEIITKILQTSGSLVEEELSQSPDMLIRELKAHEDRSKDFSSFGLMSPLDTQKIVNVLKSNTKTDSSIISRVLKPYLDSVTARFDALQDTQNLLTIFETTINKLFFRDKYIRLHVRDGLKIFTDEGKELSPETLSSGEKQLLLLFCNTLTARDKATIFIIDEPEISLNVKWQRQLIHALLELTKGSQVQFILATHSIELLSQYNNNVVKLVKMEK